MSKYDPLWEWIEQNGESKIKLSFEEIESITGFELDHSFLSFKKELESYGYKAGKISMKRKTVEFEKTV